MVGRITAGNQCIRGLDDHEFPRDAALQSLAGYLHFVLARLLYRKQRFAESIPLFNEALRHGDYWKYYYWRGKAHDHSDDYDAAVANYDRAAARHPQTTDLLDDRGGLHYRGGRLNEALADLDLALALAPLDPDTRVTRAIVLESLDRHAEARDDYDVATVYGGDDVRVLYHRGAPSCTVG